jgi:hypothetical protein
MAKSILSVDMVSIGLVLGEGDIDITLKDLYNRVMQYQTNERRVFGTSDTDFSAALSSLIFLQTQMAGIFDYNDVLQLKFRDIILEILNFEEVYMNDEGENWIAAINYDDEQLARYFKLDRKGYVAKNEIKEAMSSFFRYCHNNPIDSGQINDFMKQVGITKQILEECSEDNPFC